MYYLFSTEAANRLLEGILDPTQFAPNGFLHLLESLPPEIDGRLFPSDDGMTIPPQRIYDLIPAACETGYLDAVVWLLFRGVDSTVKGQRVGSSEFACFIGIKIML